VWWWCNMELHIVSMSGNAAVFMKTTSKPVKVFPLGPEKTTSLTEARSFISEVEQAIKESGESNPIEIVLAISTLKSHTPVSSNKYHFAQKGKSLNTEGLCH